MDNKALVVTLVVVFIGGLVLGSASFGGFSGRAIDINPPLVNVAQDVVGSGGVVDFTVIPRPSADSKAYLYSINPGGQDSRIQDVEYARGAGRAVSQATSYSYTLPTYIQAGQYCWRVYVSQAAVPNGEYGQDCFRVI